MSIARRQKQKKPKINIFRLITSIFFLVLFIYSGTKIIKYVIDNKNSKELTNEISKYIEEVKQENDDIVINVNFEELKKQNSDTIGFIKVNGTDIEHVVVKGKDNSYYLNHGFDKKENTAGWIFADYRNKLDGTDKNTIIYGHNMKVGTMFASLKNILNEEWYKSEENRIVTFITENGEEKYQVFSVYQIEDESYYIKTDFNNNEFKEFIDKIKSRSKFNFNVEVGEDDRILTLSTCASNTKYRIVLHAKRIN